jgi:Flp pilus assembly protein TadD
MRHTIELTPQPLPAKGDLSETPFALLLGTARALGSVCDKKVHAREANNLAREARRHDPDLAAPYVVMGMLMELVGEPARAQQLFRHALQRDPQREEARKALAKLRGEG